MIIFDTETTGLLQPLSIPLSKQPRIIEISAIKLDDKTLKAKGTASFLVNPGFPITEEITRITGITNTMLKDQPPFIARYPELVEFFLGERLMIAHNLDFDATQVQLELTRLGKEFYFPWPPKRICSVEASIFVKGHRLKLSELFEIATGKKLVGAHRSMNDTKGLVECVRWLKGKGKIRL